MLGNKIRNILTLTSLIIVIVISCRMNIYASEDSINEAINYINNIRENMELNPLNNNKNLKKSAEYHSKYMSINDSFSTIEESGNKYYKGRYRWDRASYNKYFNPYIAEFISNSISNTKEGVINFINNPYSRIIFLDPLYEHIGIGQYEEMYTFDLGGKSRELDKEEKTSIYPYNNMENVPVTWENKYKIDPYRELKGEYNNPSLPITFSYYFDKYKIKNIKCNQIKMTNLDTNKTIKTEIILPQDDKYLVNSIIVLPLETLEYNSTYEVTINIDFRFENNLTKKNREYKVSFSTEGKDIPLTRGKFTEYIVKSLELEIMNPKKTFKDIDIKSNKSKYIYTAYKNNLVSGYSNNTFKPNKYITKEQVLTILVRAYEKKYGEIKLENKIKYNSNFNISSWAKEYVMKADKIGLITKELNDNYQDETNYIQYQKLIEQYKKIVNSNNL